jgi:hypothetical protein
MTTFSLEHFGPRKEQKNGRPYRSFWLKVITESMVMTIKGCMYYIDTATIKTLSLGKGPSLILFDPITFKALVRQAHDTFIALGEPEPTCSEEKRKEIQKQVRERLKRERNEK